jgi:arsenate reductase (thioredoxin)
VPGEQHLHDQGVRRAALTDTGSKPRSQPTKDAMNPDRPLNVLFLCTGNSARSILAEVMMNAMGAPRFKAYSAGSHPNGKVNPFALELLQKNRLPVEGLRSKSWDEFAAPGAPELDFVFTVCDSAAGEVCPLWPGQPITAHWGVEDPAAVEGSDDDKRKAFFSAYNRLHNRIQLFLNLPLAKLDRVSLTHRLKEIGRH